MRDQTRVMDRFRLKRPLPIIAATFIVAIAIYLLYDLVGGWVRPCESVFAQSAVQLGVNLEVAKTRGELIIGRQKVQEITDQAQGTALNLKTCCILLHDDKVTGAEFLKCQRTANDYAVKVENLLNLLVQAQRAKQQDQTQALAEIQEKLSASVKGLTKTSDEFTSMVGQFKYRHLPLSPDRLTQESKFPGVVAKLTKLADTGGMLTLEVNFENVTQKTLSFCVDPGDGSLLNESTGVEWKPAVNHGRISCRFGGSELLAGQKHLIWMKFKIDGPMPERLTAIVPAVLRPFESLIPR